MLAAAAVAVAAGCGSGASVAALSVSPPEVALVPAETVQLVAAAVDDAGQPLAGVEVSWSSSAAARAQVSSDGLLTGVAPGEAIITASAGGRSAFVRARVREGAVVGTAGGAVTALAGAAGLEVPAGALAAPAALAVESVGRPPIDPRLVDGTAVAVSVGAALASPATLALGYDAAKGPIGLPAGRFRLAVLDGEVWREVAGSTDDDAAHRARGPLAAAGTYAVRMAEAAAPCDAAGDRQFDFWLGTWEIRSPTGSGGHSEITRDAAGCVILERFTERDTVGLSVSFYVAETGMWHQTYVDNQGTRLFLSGRLVDGKMVLTSPTAQRMDRITWELLTGTRVKQIGEHSDDGGATWRPAFEGTYSRS